MHGTCLLQNVKRTRCALCEHVILQTCRFASGDTPMLIAVSTANRVKTACRKQKEECSKNHMALPLPAVSVQVCSSAFIPKRACASRIFCLVLLQAGGWREAQTRRFRHRPADNRRRATPRSFPSILAFGDIHQYHLEFGSVIHLMSENGEDERSGAAGGAARGLIRGLGNALNAQRCFVPHERLCVSAFLLISTSPFTGRLLVLSLVDCRSRRPRPMLGSLPLRLTALVRRLRSLER